MSNNDTKMLLQISSKTWLKNANGLFDYESKQIKNAKILIGESLCITRKGHDLNTAQIIYLHKNEEKLFNVFISQDSIYKIENQIPNNIEQTKNNVSNLDNKIWYIVNQEEMQNTQINNHFHNINKDYYISKNDIIKLGRVKYLVSEINISTNQEQKDNLNIPNLNFGMYNYINEINSKIGSPLELINKVKCLSDEDNIDKNNEEKQLCKICYLEEIDNINNPMVHLCNCKGGLNYAHYKCIKLWMKTKLVKIENIKKTVKTYYINSFNCEICKEPFPFRFKTNNNEKIYELIEIERPLNTNYLVLESLNQIKENSNIKSIHIITLTNNEDIVIGRGHDCDVKIKDISVSRYHAKLQYNIDNNSLLIKDLKSKFGTLILIKTPFEIKEPTQMQIGRTYIKVSTISFETLKNFQKNNEIKKDQKNSEENKQLGNEPLDKKDNKYEPVETEAKEEQEEKKIEDNNNMDIEEN